MQSLVVLVFSIFIVSCSGMVAPTNSGVSGISDPTSGEAQGVGGDGEFQDATGAESNGGSTDVAEVDSGGTADTTDTTDTNGGTTDNTGGGDEVAEVIGEITDLDTDLDFEPKSAYATVTGGAAPLMMLFVFNTEFSKDTFTRQIKDYDECEDIPDTETGESKSLSIMIMDAQDYSDPMNPLTIDNVNDDGFPILDAYKRETPSAMGLSVTFSAGSTSLSGGHATADVATFANLPTAAEEEFEVTIDAVFTESTATDFSSTSGAFKAKIKTIIVPTLDQPAAPECPEGQYAPPNYEDE